MQIQLDELRDIAKKLFFMAEGSSQDIGQIHIDGEENDPDRMLKLAQNIYKARQGRLKFFPEDFFGEPAWDMLLDLYIRRCQRRTVSVSSCCLASGRPMTTALRWVAVLEEGGFIRRRPHPDDNRSALLELTYSGRQKVREYLNWLTDHTPRLATAPVSFQLPQTAAG